MAEVVDLCDSDDEVAVTSSSVARMPSPRTRARLNFDGIDDDVVEIISSPENTGSRKRPRRMAALKSGDDIEIVQVEKKPPPPPTPLQQVLCIFPDVEISHAQKLLKERKDKAEDVINALCDGTYPKEPVKKKPAASGGASGLFKMKPPSSPEKPSYDFLSETSFLPSKAYINESIDQLQYFFPCLTKAGITFFMKRSGNHFAIAHNKIVRVLKCGEGGNKAGVDEEKEIRRYKKLKACTDNKVCVGQDQKNEFRSLFSCEPRQSHFSSRPRPKERVNPSNPILKEEINFVRGKLCRWMDEIETEIARKENREMSIQDGTALECACCYEQVAMDEMVQCRNEGHLFCQDCLGQSRKAGLRETICTCPKCGFTAEVPSTQTIFSCLNEDCGFESCRKCREASHIPLRCEEVEKKHESEGRTRVEEAASAAVIRFCPTCNKGMVKEDGCNKMTCPCGTKFCYLCKVKVKDYSHFCQVPHCQHNDKKCSRKCPLYTKDLDAVHEKNMREAALAEAAKVEAETVTTQQPRVAGLFGGGDSKPTATKVDVESILRAPAKRPRAH